MNWGTVAWIVIAIIAVHVMARGCGGMMRGMRGGGCGGGSCGMPRRHDQDKLQSKTMNSDQQER